MSKPATPGAALSPRESEVLTLYVGGQLPGEIAHALKLSIKTVSTHLLRCREKLGYPSTHVMLVRILQSRTVWP